MQRQLVIMRHAKAAQADHGSDHARPLTERGRRDAALIADRLTREGFIPDRVLCSDSARTVGTWMAMSPQISAIVELSVTPRLYGGGMRELDALLAEQPDHINTLLAIGHNPGFEAIVSALAERLTPLGTANAALFVCADGARGWRHALDPSEGGLSWKMVGLLRPGDEG